MAAANGTDVAGTLSAQGGFYLYSVQTSVVANDEVEVGHFSIRLVDLEPMFGSAGHEIHLGPLAAQFAVINLWIVNFHSASLWLRLVGAWIESRRMQHG